MENFHGSMLVYTIRNNLTLEYFTGASLIHRFSNSLFANGSKVAEVNANHFLGDVNRLHEIDLSRIAPSHAGSHVTALDCHT